MSARSMHALHAGNGAGRDHSGFLLFTSDAHHDQIAVPGRFGGHTDVSRPAIGEMHLEQDHLVRGAIRDGAAPLGSWLAFVRHGNGNEVMVMGDIVLTDEEVNPVMKRLVEGGIEITALHNHLLRNTPHTMYMHVAGHGDPTKLAATLREALAQSKAPLGQTPAGASVQSNAAPAAAGEG